MRNTFSLLSLLAILAFAPTVGAQETVTSTYGQRRNAEATTSESFQIQPRFGVAAVGAFGSTAQGLFYLSPGLALRGGVQVSRLVGIDIAVSGAFIGLSAFVRGAAYVDFSLTEWFSIATGASVQFGALWATEIATMVGIPLRTSFHFGGGNGIRHMFEIFVEADAGVLVQDDAEHSGDFAVSGALGLGYALD